ncbi:MAG: GNAT family N-acetyltransferase [Candidatus Aminicenantes bacterium]|nr:GNAT family N-acetyltransferase [Candidatus Aminicenantes bacterium]
MENVCVRQIERDRWEEVINHFPYNLYNTLSMIDVICNSYNGEAIFLTFWRKDNLVGCMNLILVKELYLKSAFAPMTRLWGRPTLLLLEAEKNNIKMFVDLLCRYLKQMNVDVLHIYFLLPQDYPYLIKRLDTKIISLEDKPENLWKRVHPTGKRRYVQYALKYGVNVRPLESYRDLETFYQMYTEVWNKMDISRYFRKKHTLAYFQNLINNPQNILWLAYREKTLLAGTLVTSGNGTAYYQHNASFSKYQKYFPNHLLMWNAIKSAAASGNQYFDLAGVYLNMKRGIFKSGWGKSCQESYYYYSIPLSQKGKILVKTFKFENKLYNIFIKR